MDIVQTTFIECMDLSYGNQQKKKKRDCGNNPKKKSVIKYVSEVEVAKTLNVWRAKE